MKTIATFSNYAEAGFVQSLLQEEGIESFAPDAGSMPNGVFHVPVQVAESDWTRASEIIARFQAENKTKPDPVADHPATGFPFLGIMGFVAMLWMLGTTIWVFFTDDDSITLPERLGVSLTAGVFSLLLGLMVGFFVALLCLICRPVFDKLKTAE